MTFDELRAAWRAREGGIDHLTAVRAALFRWLRVPDSITLRKPKGGKS